MQRCYENLKGCNWLSLQPAPYASRWPSEKVKQVIGVPLPDLRTLAADYLRSYDPVAAPTEYRRCAAGTQDAGSGGCLHRTVH